jgi:hypothetical protein
MGGILIGLNWSVFEICGSSAVDALIIVGIVAILTAHSAGVPKGGKQRSLREGQIRAHRTGVIGPLLCPVSAPREIPVHFLLRWMKIVIYNGV